MLRIISIFTLFSFGPLKAAPIDLHGSFGADSTLIDNYRRTENTGVASSDNNQILPLASGSPDQVSFQSYLLKLEPTITVNDSASLFGEITTGYGRGGIWGDDSVVTQNDSFGNALYYHNTSDGDSKNVALTRFNMELYSDFGTYIVGRQASDWGLGAVYNSGQGIWDRHQTVRDGVQAKLKIGHFNINPYWFKLSSAVNLAKESNVKEFGISLLYDNPERELAFGILFGKKRSKPNDTSLTTDINDSGAGTRSLSKTSVKVTDIFIKSSFGDFSVAVEAPIFSGDIGPVFNTGENSKYKAQAVLVESKYNFSEEWSASLHGGTVSGDSGQTSNFEAMFLHPNYQIANLLFRYNLYAVNDLTQSIYDSYVTNANFIKFGVDYKSDNWQWNTSLVYAIAQEAAKSGQLTYNHSTNESFTASANQEDDLGFEIDTNFDYYWNQNVTIGASLGYFVVGDYWTFTDSSTTLSAKNSLFAQFRTSIDF